jgi:hypothetical protein
VVTPKELERLMQVAVEDKREEPAFFRALLDAIVYAHAPVSDDSRRLRLIQFLRPDGLTVLPFFTDRTKAQFAARSAARIVELTGRQLLTITRGVTLMLNPNDTHCTLYPEEVEALLTTGGVATVEKLELDERQIGVRSPESHPAWLGEALITLFQRLPSVETAYMIETWPAENPSQVSLVIAIGVMPAESERVARAAITQIQPRCEGLDVAIDLTTFDPVEGFPEWLDYGHAEPFYRRADSP